MSFAVFVNLFGAGLIALLTPVLAYYLTHTGLLCLFAGLDLIAWLLCYLFYPETAGINLEELRAVFEVPLGAQARYRFLYLQCLFKHYIVALWTKEYVEFPDPLHIWWREQPKSEKEKREYQDLHKREKRARKDQRRREKQERKWAKTAQPDVGKDDHDASMAAALEEERHKNAELNRQLQELREAQLRQRTGREAESTPGGQADGGGDESSTAIVGESHEHRE